MSLRSVDPTVENLQLANAIRLLRRFPNECRVVLEDGRSIGSVGSYRGYYFNLALEPADDDQPRNVADLLKLLDDAWGADFEGYKGGTYTMTGRTDLWVSPYGEASSQMLTRIVGRVGTDLVVLKTDEEVW